MAKKLESFAFVGIKNLVFKSKQTHNVECYLKHFVNLTLSDETAQDFLRGGYGNPKLLTIYGDRDTKLTGSTATMTTDLLKIMSSNEVATKTKDVQVVEEIEVDGGVFTLTKQVSGTVVDIYALDDTGLSTKLTEKAGADLADGEYEIDGQEVTCMADVAKIRAFYMTSKEVQSIEGKDFVAKTYECNGTLVAKCIEDQTLYIANLELPNVTVAPTFSLTSQNTSSAPDAIELSLDLVMDANKGYSYSIDFYEEI